MHQGTLSLSFATLLIVLPLHAQEASTAASSQPGAVTSPVIEQTEEPLQVPADDLGREPEAGRIEHASAQVVRLRQENQRLKLQLKETQAEQLPPPLSERQTWFLIGGGVVFLSFIAGSLLRGNRRSRREWLN